MRGKTHDLNRDLTFSAHTINCVRQSTGSIFRVPGIYNFEEGEKKKKIEEVNFLYSHLKNVRVKV